MNVKSLIARKLLTSFICIAMYPLIILLLIPSRDANPNFFINFINEIDGVFGLLLLHGAILLLYGLPVSIGIEFLTSLVYRIPKMNTTLQHTLKHVTALLLHLIFGLILFFFSLISASLFFIIDFMLQLTKRNFTFIHVLIGALILLTLTILLYTNTTNW